MPRTLLVSILVLALAASSFVPLAAAAPGGDAAGAAHVAAALDQVAPRDRLRLLGVGMQELGGWRYGPEFAKAFGALGGSYDPAQQKMLVLSSLQGPIVAAGCARAVATAMRAVPAAQGELLRTGCPASAPLFPAARVAHAPMELVLIALLIEQRARQGGYAGEPLHKKAINVLLTPRP